MHKASAFFFVCAGLAGLAFLLPRPAAAAWPIDPAVNVSLCTATGEQTYSQSVADGAGEESNPSPAEPVRRRHEPGHSFYGLSVVGGLFVMPEMNRAYQSHGGARFDYTRWFTPHWAGRTEFAFTGGSGQISVVDPAVQVETNDMTLTGFPLLLQALYRPRESFDMDRTWPYFGLGFGLFGSAERIEFRGGTLDIVQHGGATSCTFAAIAGLHFHVKQRLYGIAELRWVQSGPGRYESSTFLGPKTDEEKRVQRRFEAMVRHPDYDATGPEITFGLRWRR
jgi:opacity protein-like surface antigen